MLAKRGASEAILVAKIARQSRAFLDREAQPLREGIR